MSFNEFYQEFKKMKLTGNDFDNPLSTSQFTRSIRPIVLFASFICIVGFVDVQYQLYYKSQKQMQEIKDKNYQNLNDEEKVLVYKNQNKNKDTFMELYQKLKLNWLKHQYTYFDVIPLQGSLYCEIQEFNNKKNNENTTKQI